MRWGAMVRTIRRQVVLGLSRHWSPWLPCVGGAMSTSDSAFDARLLEAVRRGAVEDIVEAIKRGADVNAADDYGETVLDLTISLAPNPHAAAELVRCLLQAGAVVGRAKDQSALGSVLHQAALHGNLEALRLLLNSGQRLDLNTFDDIGRTPLMCAIDRGHLAACELLLAAGVDVDAHDVDQVGDVALSRAISNRNLEMVRLLVRHKANPTIPGWMQLTPWERALQWRELDPSPEAEAVVRLLQNEGRE
jgi:ankyrin repeat protein